jgi:hypothetical protein
MSRRSSRMISGASLALGGAATAYQTVLRDRCLSWGASAEEVAREMPGDELIADPDMLATRAITINAPPSAIWPWLVQMGSGRGGAYTYDWIENLLGLDMHSADEVLPEHQVLEVGDLLPMGTKGAAMRVEVLDPERFLVFRVGDGNWVWIFGLYPESSTTRLVSRNRISVPQPSLLRRLFNLLFMEPGSLVMERKMLLGIKERAERLAGEQPGQSPS